VEKNLSLILRTGMATTTWLVRRACWLTHKLGMSKIFKTAAHVRVHGKNNIGTLVNLLETVLALRPVDASGGRKKSNWDSRWRVSLWLGETSL
jgi:hypothetical protein